MKRLASYINEHEATICQAKLKDAGIRCFIKNQHVSNLKFGHGINAATEIDLMVVEEDYELAAHILDIVTIEEENICPKCSSKNTEPKFKSSPALMVFLLLFAFLPIPFFREKHVCKDCGQRF